jgi:uncharacterized protein
LRQFDGGITGNDSKGAGMKRVAWIVVGWLVLGGAAQAASFDCAKAGTKVEHLICDSPELSKLDDELAVVYMSALQDKRTNQIRQAQKQWVKERNGCEDTVCVRRTYESRLLFLRNADTQAKTVTGDVNKPKAHYVLRMSEDDSVCKPVLAEYNKNIQLDFYRPIPFHYYPWPAPPKLAVEWEVKSWSKSIPERERTSLERMYSIIEADVGGDGETETIVRWATWLRRDDRFSTLDIFPHNIEILGGSQDEYESQAMQQAIKIMGGGGYNFPKFKGRASPRTLNDFDVIRFDGKYYVTGKTVDMDGVIEMRDSPRWRVIGRVRYGEPELPSENDLDWILDSVCYFEMKNTQ